MERSSFISAFCVNGKIMYAKVDWKENDTDLFHIQIYDRQNWWTGRFSNSFAEEYRERMDEEVEVYRNNVKASLMNKSMFEYDFAPILGDSETAQFSWKKIYKGSNKPVSLVHGSIPVHRNSSLENTNSIIDFLLDENKSLRKLIADYELNMHTLNSELEQSKSELEKFMNVKRSLEMSVYGKFINLLNSKKRRIHLLEQNILKYEKAEILRNSEVD